MPLIFVRNSSMVWPQQEKVQLRGLSPFTSCPCEVLKAGGSQQSSPHFEERVPTGPGARESEYLGAVELFATSPPNLIFHMISPPTALFRAVSVVDAKHPPIGPDFA